jgi:hypothetical protein
MFPFKTHRKAHGQLSPQPQRRRRRPCRVLQLQALEERTLLSFAAPINYDTGSLSVAVGDVNGDGTPDLVAANNITPGTVGVLLGNGDGTFQAPRTYDAGPGPRFVAMADLTGTGKLDLVVADLGNIFTRDPGYAAVLLGNGDGTFRSPILYRAGANPAAVAVGDFNGDGIPDLAVANNDIDNVGPPSVSVLLGNGDGSFRDAVNYDVSPDPQSVAVGDFNGDGNLDLVVTNHLGNVVSVLLGNGDGKFQTPQTYTAGPDPYSVAVGDFNGDGISDLAIANNVQSGTVSVLLGNGDGSFQTPQTYAAGINAIFVTAADLNADGNLDLITTNDATTRVLLGNGDGTFQPAVNYAEAGGFSVAVGDFRGAGVQDLAVAGRGVTILLGNGDGTFPTVPTYDAGSSASAVAVGDFNGDGIPDLVTADPGEVRVLLGNGDGSFQAAVSYTGVSPGFVAVGDFNGDGNLDLVVTNPGLGTVSVLLGNGDGTFGAPVSYAAGRNPSRVAVGDFNDDGKLDIVVINSIGFRATVSVLLGNGDGTFGAPVPYGVGNEPLSIAVGDFNGDGIPDIAVANQGAGDPGNVSVLLGNGDGTFRPAVNYNAGVFPDFVAVGDFRGNGKLDLAVSSASGISLLLGNGDGTFQPAHLIATGPGRLIVEDFDDDGNLDLAVADSSRRTIDLLLGNGDGSFQPVQHYVPGGAGALAAAAGDFNGDGFPDLAVTGGPNGVAILLNAADWPAHPSTAHPRRRQSTPEMAGFRDRQVQDLALMELLPATTNEHPLTSAAGTAITRTERLQPGQAPADVGPFDAAPTRGSRRLAPAPLLSGARSIALERLEELFRIDGIWLNRPLPAGPWDEGSPGA